MYDDSTSNLIQNCSVMSGNKVIVKNSENGRGIETDNQGNKKKCFYLEMMKLEVLKCTGREELLVIGTMGNETFCSL